VSLASPFPAFLFFFPAPDFELGLVGVAWLEAPSPLMKLVERGVGAIAAAGVEDAVSTGVSFGADNISHSFIIAPCQSKKN
jgi:hypothetical protein